MLWGCSYAFDRCFEGAVAALAAPLVGYLAQHGFGFKGDAARTGDPEEDRRRAAALGAALVWFMVLPWVCSFILYSGGAACQHLSTRSMAGDLTRSLHGARMVVRLSS